MRSWLLLAAAIFVVGLLFLTQGPASSALRQQGQEAFADYDTALAQRQQQQFEGENRYNDLARVQGSRIQINNDQVRDALEQTIPAATGYSESLLTLFKDVGLGATAPPSGGTGVEQTGAVQQKIDFCESLKTVDCDLLSDPRMAECGFCHLKGKDSQGRLHRGGMYISSDDQIRANELSTANGNAKAIYTPTIGTCKASDFTLMKETCEARERTLDCQRAGAATSDNKCGQCFGSAPAGSTGLLYMGKKPLKFDALLHLSHPGMNGPAIVRQTNGEVTRIENSITNLLAPVSVPLKLVEGERISITLSGIPSFWCAWLSNIDGNRNISLDVGVESMQPANGMVIVGDKRSVSLNKAMEKASASGWTAWRDKMPNNVLWYRRRDDVLRPSVVAARFYGSSTRPEIGSSWINITDSVKWFVYNNKDFKVSAKELNIMDINPAYSMILDIQFDNGTSLWLRENETVSVSKLNSSIVFDVVIPATLADPFYPEDCPSGPIVLTAEGAGRMGANSCFASDGSFSPSIVCMQQLWNSAGADPKGKLYPTTAAQAKALAKSTIDETVNFLNSRVNIAMYGVDVNGAPQEFDVIRKASLDYFGIEMRNPCDGPTKETGPHTPECLDYLWRTSGNASQDGVAVDRKKLPYAYCNPSGDWAPIRSDGTVNRNAVNSYGLQGGVQTVRSIFTNIYNSARDSTKGFDWQSMHMKACYGVALTVPQEDSATCPPPNSEEWQCFPVDKIPRDVVDPNYVPAFRFDRSAGDVVGMSSTGGAIHTFPSTDACIAWTKGPKNNPKPNGVNRDQPFLTRGYAREYIRGRV